jgi:nitroreductase
MLSACGALALVTWLPQFSCDSAELEKDADKDKQIQIDEEHLAATSAFVQNLLLLLTAEGLGTYWSSGGQFRLPAMFDHLKIPSDQRTLAAIFVDYSPTNVSTERIAGKLRDRRSDSSRWTRWV